MLKFGLQENVDLYLYSKYIYIEDNLATKSNLLRVTVG